MNPTDTSPTLPKTFDPAAIEARWYAHWEDNGLFRPAGTPDNPRAEPFTIVNPPPNVTGSLHVGHALDNTLQDIVVRYERLRGKDSLWVVGTDHAGIATQMVVERNLASQGLSRAEMGREAFLQHVWEWKAQSGGAITRQLRRLGCSMDWSREQFTMDPHFSKAVTHTFVRLYNDGLIYRDKRLVNWDPKLKTAISDLEVETREVAGKFWHIRYPLADGARTADGADHIVVATTRPETMLADMAVAVHPDDPRYKLLWQGKAEVVLPITGRRVRIVADEHADPELGSGAVKITPGHDFNDFEVGKRAGFRAGEMLNMLDAEARVVQCGGIPAALVGLDRFEARERVVALLAEQNLLNEIEDRVIPTPYGDRGGVVIEPWLTDQWYVDAEKLAGAPLDAVRDGEIEIVPKTWEKTFFNWMESIQPWCVSRQLWWGHRIPAWYGPRLNDSVITYDFAGTKGRLERFIYETEEAAVCAAQHHYGPNYFIEVVEDDVEAMHKGIDHPEPGRITIWQDPDVLDTWFSSALWPFATLGWPDRSSEPDTVRPEPVEGQPFSSGAMLEDQSGASTSSARTGLDGDARNLLARHYPNDLLISGFDILFFWDARMAMMGMHLTGEAPWKRLYLHGLVRAADGQKMSKSKGNVVDPLGLIDRYGADALRFFMAAMESQGRDVKMDEKRVEGYRNFATKLWNAARFCQANGIGASQAIAAPPATLAVNKWIVGEVVETLSALDKAMAELRFDAAANAIYHFVWDTFCDWYLELIKPVLGEPAPPEAEETRMVAGWVLDQILVMLHPFMPFVSEELWHALGQRPYELIVARWPRPEAAIDADAKREVEWLIAVISQLRTAKNELGIHPGARLEAYLPDAEAGTRDRVERNRTALDRLARLSGIRFEAAPSGAAMQIGIGNDNLVVPLEGVIDIAAEKARLAKARDASSKERDALAKRLGNPQFVDKAKPEAVEKARTDHAHHAAEAERLAAALARLG